MDYSTQSGGFYTDRKTVKETYSWELKENLGRRALASVIDYMILGFIMIIVGGIFTLAIGPLFIGQANPAVLVVGILANFVLPPMEGSTTIKTMPIPVAALIFAITSTLVIFGFFAIFESNGRRTPGKWIMKLELHRTDGTFPTFTGAFTRNLTKIVCAFLGGALFGLLGIILLTAPVLILEYILFSDGKFDLRQRYSETIKGTLVLMEDEETEPGKISIPEDERRKKPEKKKEEALPPHKEKEEDIPALPEHKEEKEDEEEIPGEEEAEETEEEDAGSGKKGPFMKKLFGKKKETPKIPAEEEEATDSPKDVFEKLPPTEKDREEEEIVLRFMMDFDIDEDRARGLVEMGYTDKIELRDAIPKDLMMVKGINPTIAKRIIKKANE
ncbi:MAG: RDD family protein [Thermoplasmatota archaeon]